MRRTLTDHEVELLLGALGTDACPCCLYGMQITTDILEDRHDLGFCCAVDGALPVCGHPPYSRSRHVSPDRALAALRDAGLVAP